MKLMPIHYFVGLNLRWFGCPVSLSNRLKFPVKGKKLFIINSPLTDTRSNGPVESVRIANAESTLLFSLRIS